MKLNTMIYIKVNIYEKQQQTYAKSITNWEYCIAKYFVHFCHLQKGAIQQTTK